VNGLAVGSKKRRPPVGQSGGLGCSFKDTSNKAIIAEGQALKSATAQALGPIQSLPSAFENLPRALRRPKTTASSSN
jgi:hypothetical protein